MGFNGGGKSNVLEALHTIVILDIKIRKKAGNNPCLLYIWGL